MILKIEDRTASPHLSVANFTELVERQQHALFVYLRLLVTHQEEAQELLQETFLEAWRAAQQGKPPFLPNGDETAMRGWLFHVASCRGIDLLRRRQLVRWVSLDALLEAGEALGGTALCFEDQLVERTSIQAALEKLAPKEKICLLLIAVQGFTAAEAAQIIHDSSQAVAKRFSRAKRRLLEAYLAGEGKAQQAAIQEIRLLGTSCS